MVGWGGHPSERTFVEAEAMILSVEATYENGVLRPEQPLPLRPHERVWVTVHQGVSRARQTAGLMGWSGSAELADRFAMDPELEYPPPSEDP
jgi:predicted DNA-binding antitoxin AbrB/MazE fold protein